MKPTGVTACLITYKRQDNIPQIIASLQKWPFITEIMIRDNSKMKNIINYGRYTQGEKASNNIIYTQDDDCVINNLDEVYAAYMKDPQRLAHSGIEDYQKVIPDNIFRENQMSLMGWGSFFHKAWIPKLDKYIDKYGYDYCFYRETDRIFSLLLQKRSSFVLGNITVLPGARDENALSSQSNHIEFKKLAMERALSLINYQP